MKARDELLRGERANVPRMEYKQLNLNLNLLPSEVRQRVKQQTLAASLVEPSLSGSSVENENFQFSYSLEGAELRVRPSRASVKTRRIPIYLLFA